MLDPVTVNTLFKANPKGLNDLLGRFNLANTGITTNGIIQVAQANPAFKSALNHLLEISGFSQTEAIATEAPAPDNFLGSNKVEEKEPPRVFGMAKPLAVSLFFAVFTLVLVILVKRAR